MKDKVVHLGKRFLSHELVNGSSLIFIGTTFSNICAFLFNLFLVRNLSVGLYGEYAALISLVTLVSIPAQSFAPVLVQFASRFHAKGETKNLKELYYQSSRFFLIVTLIVFVAFFVATPFVHTFFHINSFAAIFISGLVIASIYLGLPNNAFLQSQLKFGFLSYTTALGGIIKLLLGIGFILLGLSISGALGAFFLSFLIPLLITFIPLKKIVVFKKQIETTVSMGEISKYALPAVISVFALSAFTSMDVLLVKHFFSSVDAGLYGGLSLAGRIIFYFTLPITTVMFPLVIKRFEEGRNFKGLLYAAMGLVLVPSLCISLLYFTLPHIAIQIFLGGGRYLAIGSYLGLYGLYLTLFSVVNVLVNFFLSLKKTRVVLFLVVAEFLQILLISLFHATFLSVILDSSISVLLLFVVLLLYYFSIYGKKTFKKN